MPPSSLLLLATSAVVIVIVLVSLLTPCKGTNSKEVSHSTLTHREHQQTVIMVSHDPVAAAHADSVVFLTDGRIVGTLTDPTAAAVSEEMLRLEATIAARRPEEGLS